MTPPGHIPLVCVLWASITCTRDFRVKQFLIDTLEPEQIIRWISEGEIKNRGDVTTAGCKIVKTMVTSA